MSGRERQRSPLRFYFSLDIPTIPPTDARAKIVHSHTCIFLLSLTSNLEMNETFEESVPIRSRIMIRVEEIRKGHRNSILARDS